CNIAVPNHSSDRAAVLRGRKDARVLHGFEGVGMNKIGMKAIFSERDAFQKRMPDMRRQRVPAHMRDAQLALARVDGLDITLNPVEAFCGLMLKPRCRKELHADADAEKGPP